MTKMKILGMAAVFAFFAAPVLAQPVKKYVTPDNRVIYSDQPVPGAREAGEVAAPRPVSPEDRDAAKKAAERDARQAKTLDARVEERRQQAARIEQLEAELELAKKQLAEGKEPLAGERTGTAGGASRLNDSYWARQKELESAVAEAQKALEEARTGK